MKSQTSSLLGFIHRMLAEMSFIFLSLSWWERQLFPSFCYLFPHKHLFWSHSTDKYTNNPGYWILSASKFLLSLLRGDILMRKYSGCLKDIWSLHKNLKYIQPNPQDKKKRNDWNAHWRLERSMVLLARGVRTKFGCGKWLSEEQVYEVALRAKVTGTPVQ